MKIYVMGTLEKSLTDVLLISTYKMCFYEEVRKKYDLDISAKLPLSDHIDEYRQIQS